MTDLSLDGQPVDESKPANDADLVRQWLSAIQQAQQDVKDWNDEADDITARYRAEERKNKPGKYSKATKYNVLWSNVQTLAPALYHKAPKCVVQRRYLDRDPIGRIACRILERAVQYQIDLGELHTTVQRCVLDRLLAGRGIAWCRYEPTIEKVLAPEGMGHESGPALDDDDDEDPAAPPMIDQIKREVVHVDYVQRKDFVCETARTWEEVSWIAKRAYMSQGELAERFGQAAVGVPLNNGPERDDEGGEPGAETKKATVWEIWNRTKRQVVWIAENHDAVLDLKDDPIGLEGFFPCPAPLFATVTNETLIPVPDFVQIRSQAEEMDDLTRRIERIVSAIRVRGAYDNSTSELADILNDNDENTLVPIDNFAAFTSAGGFKGAVSFMPIDMFADVLKELYEARDHVKAEVYEITGLSDVLRGQGDPDETATGVREKGRFASLRLKSQQERVAVFVRDIVRIMAEMTCVLFQPQTLGEMASVEEMDDLQIPAPPPPMPMMPGPGPVPAPQGAPLQPQRLPAMAG